MFVLNKKVAILGIIVLTAVIIGVNYIFRSDETPSQQSPDSGGAGAGVMGKPINEIPKYVGRPLDEIRFGAGFNAPETAVEKRRGDLKVLAAVLNANPMGSGGVDDWIAVGVIKKFFNNFEGARDAWEYAGVLYPANALSFANLGNLYGFYLHDNTKAELNFKKAVSNDSYQPGYYISFADFYRNVDTVNKTKAVDVILQGLERIKDVNLALYLATYYRDEGDKANALKYYQEVLKLSPNHAGIAEEIDRLK